MSVVHQDERFKALEDDVDLLMHQIKMMKTVIEAQTTAIKEMQQFAIRLGVSQNRLNERVLKWPFIEVPVGGSEK